MAEIVTLSQEKLPMQLDSVSWNKKFNLLAIGAYMIDPTDSTKRIGKIFLIQLNLGTKEDDNDKCNLHEIIQEVDLSGVLDLRWEPDHQLKLAIATSTSLELYELQSNSDMQLKLVNRIQLDAMALYTQWMSPDKLLYSDSEGVINVVAAEPLEIQTSQKVHDNLTWVVQHSNKSGLIFAGSDEGKFTGFLLENINDEEKHYTKKFQVGVTSIIFLKNNVLGVGSYDDRLHLFTIDCVDPIVLSLKKKIEFGGAVWRTLAFPINTASASENDDIEDFHIVAACARNGIHVVSLNTTSWAYDTLASCLEYEGFLAYGLDVKANRHEKSKSYVIASCYFDNNQLHLWKTDIPNLN